MRDNKEIEGTLCGFDDFFSKMINYIIDMVLENVIELDKLNGNKENLESILLHGSHICMVFI